LTYDVPKNFDGIAEPYNDPVRIVQEVSENSFLKSIAREGDVILPLELCILRRDETFKQWSARGNGVPSSCWRCSFAAARNLDALSYC
jgi:hypothetical protein